MKTAEPVDAGVDALEWHDHLWRKVGPAGLYRLYAVYRCDSCGLEWGR